MARQRRGEGLRNLSLRSDSAPAWRTPLLLLVLLFGLTWLALVLRGLEFGFTGDLLDYAFHYDRLGTFGGMRWLVTEHLQRHVIAGLVSAPIAYLFPGQAAPWYAYLFLVHFIDAILVFFLANTLLHGRYRWVSFAAALVFAFHVVQVPTLLGFPTGGHRTTALGFSLISLWLYVLYRRRAGRGWLELSFIGYVVAILLYEQTVLFFLLHPLFAYLEDARAGNVRFNLRWLLRLAVDSAAFPLFVVGYLFLLSVLFPPSDQLTLNPEHLLNQVRGGLLLTLDPAYLLAIIGSAITAAPLLTLAGVLAVFGLLAGMMRHTPTTPGAHSRRALGGLAVIGLALIFASVLGVSPSEWAIADHPRSVYAASVGLGFLVAGGLALLLSYVPTAGVRVALFSLAVALFVGSGFSEFFVQQDGAQARADIRDRFFAAVHAAVPAVDRDNPPYLLIYTDAHPTDDLWLYAQDNRFTLAFDWLYGTNDMPVDVIYANLDPALAPPDTLPGRRYNGQFIVVEPEGIYSPLKPFVPIDPERLIVVAYDSATGEARVVDSLPADVRASANIVERAPVEWRTNHALLPESAP